MSAGQWIAGINAVAAALEHDPDHVLEVLIEAGGRNPRLVEIEQRAQQLGISARRVALQALDGIAGGLRHQGAIARYVGARSHDDADLPALIEAAGKNALLLVLDGVQDLHVWRVPAQRRSCRCDRSSGDSERQIRSGERDSVRKTSSGAADRVPVVRVTNLARALRAIRDAGVWVYGLAGDTSGSLYAIDLRGPVALVLGGEADGLRRLTRENCDALVQIPMPGVDASGGVESLNVSVATGVALFEAVRQRGIVK